MSPVTPLRPPHGGGATAPPSRAVLTGAAVALVVAGALALLVAARWGPLVELDRRTTRAAERADLAAPWLLSLARLTTHLGDPLVVTVGSLLLAAVLALTRHSRLALLVVLARGAALLASQSLKAAVGRMRPQFADPVASADGPSFPSGHALGGTSFWLVLAMVVLALALTRRRRAVVAGALLVAAAISASRVLLGVHYLSDVVAGFLLGLAVTALVAAAVGARRDRP